MMQPAGLGRSDKSSKQDFNTEITEKRIKPLSYTGEIIFVNRRRPGRNPQHQRTFSEQLCGLIFFPVISVLKVCLLCRTTPDARTTPRLLHVAPPPKCNHPGYQAMGYRPVLPLATCSAVDLHQ
jgi:hypothetical protein